MIGFAPNAPNNSDFKIKNRKIDSYTSVPSKIIFGSPN